MIIGDINIDIMCGENISHEFLNNFSEKEYVPCFLGITRSANDGCNGTCIDNIFLKSNSITPKAYKLCTNEISDHYPLIVALDNVTIKQVNNRLNNFINCKKLLNKANLTEWNSILLIHDSNEAVNMLISKIKNCLNNASSCKTNKKRDREMIPRKNWISTAIIISCKKKEMLYKLWKMKPDCKDLKNEYKNYFKLLDKVIKDAKFKFERNKIDKNSKDPK